MKSNLKCDVGRECRGLFRLFLAGNAFLGILLAAALFVLVAGLGEKVPAQTPPVPEVEVMTVTQKDVPVFSEWVGTTEGLVNAKIRAQVTGYLARQAYKEGASVKKGDLLFEIDPRTFKAALDQADSPTGDGQGQTGEEPSWMSNATGRSPRRAPSVSRSSMTPSRPILPPRPRFRLPRRTVEQARLSLSFTKITSPVDGIAGSANAQIGDLVGPTQTGELTTVSTVDPIKVYFPISEQEYMVLARQSGGN